MHSTQWIISQCRFASDPPLQTIAEMLFGSRAGSTILSHGSDHQNISATAAYKHLRQQLAYSNATGTMPKHKHPHAGFANTKHTSSPRQLLCKLLLLAPPADEAAAHPACAAPLLLLTAAAPCCCQKQQHILHYGCCSDVLLHRC
jgi:hypothetical protein